MHDPNYRGDWDQPGKDDAGIDNIGGKDPQPQEDPALELLRLFREDIDKG